MNKPLTFPFDFEHRFNPIHCKLPLHEGTATCQDQQTIHQFQAQFVVPPQGDCLILLYSESGHPREDIDIKSGLKIVGGTLDGPFSAFSPQLRIKASSGFKKAPTWIVASPMNGAMAIEYGLPSRSIHKVDVLINNFDFRFGNVTENLPLIRVNALGRAVEFRWRENRSILKVLLDSEVFDSTALSAYSFHAWEGATEDNLVEFAHNIASLCTYGVGQYTGVSVITFLDPEGRAIRRIIKTPIESTFRKRGVLDDAHVPHGIPLLFEHCFDQHLQMQASKLPWRKLASYCASIEDPPILEQKFASLMMALEFFIRNSLVEAAGGQTSSQIESLKFSQLFDLARKTLGWIVPKHYAHAGLVRLLRNAVMHGGALPIKDNREFRQTFDKWKLFLFRRVLIRLGYRGQVVSPHQGWVSSSQVDDFSEEHNSYTY